VGPKCEEILPMQKIHLHKMHQRSELWSEALAGNPDDQAPPKGRWRPAEDPSRSLREKESDLPDICNVEVGTAGPGSLARSTRAQSRIPLTTSTRTLCCVKTAVGVQSTPWVNSQPLSVNLTCGLGQSCPLKPSFSAALAEQKRRRRYMMSSPQGAVSSHAGGALPAQVHSSCGLLSSRTSCITPAGSQ
jgi:hypothetical protein